MAADWKQIEGDNKEKYQLYLCSREWSEKKRAVHERCGGICERCGLNPVDAVHHLTYARKYDELLEDLQGTCDGCHKFTHGMSDSDPANRSRFSIPSWGMIALVFDQTFVETNWQGSPFISFDFGPPECEVSTSSCVTEGSAIAIDVHIDREDGGKTLSLDLILEFSKQELQRLIELIDAKNRTDS